MMRAFLILVRVWEEQAFFPKGALCLLLMKGIGTEVPCFWDVACILLLLWVWEERTFFS